MTPAHPNEPQTGHDTWATNIKRTLCLNPKSKVSAFKQRTCVPVYIEVQIQKFIISMILSVAPALPTT